MPETTIKFKFNIGDTVYRIKCDKGMNDLGVICPVCNGTGKFKSPSSGQAHDCPGVNGYMCKNGRMHVVWRNCYYPVRDGVDFICIEQSKDVNRIFYGLDSEYEVGEDELYSTLEEAQAACDHKNGLDAPIPLEV